MFDITKEHPLKQIKNTRVNLKYIKQPTQSHCLEQRMVLAKISPYCILNHTVNLKVILISYLPYT